MSKKAVLGAIGACVALCLIGVTVLTVLWINRDRAAVATYRVEVPDGQSMSDVVDNEAALLKSDEVLVPVIAELDLLTRWKYQTDAEALTRMRTKLLVKQTSLGDYVKVVYRDKSQDRALEILDAINRQFAIKRREAAALGKVPRVVGPAER